MNMASCFSLPPTLRVERVIEQSDILLVAIASAQVQACCPSCGTPSERVHCRYRRTVADLSCAGRRVVLQLTVRTFVCSQQDCSQRLFAERFPGLVAAYARKTDRLCQMLQALGMATGGSVGARLAARLGMPASRSTVLRHLHNLSPPAEPAVRALGVDDFCWKRGRTWGTLLVDLERGQPIDVLADRTAGTLAGWLRRHPEVQIMSRDRGGDYARAGREAAPQALHIADRYHLVRNLCEAVERGLQRYQRDLKCRRLLTSANRTHPAPLRYIRPERATQRQQARQRCLDRYEAIQERKRQGVSHLEIARRLHLARSTVVRYAHAPQFPERPAHPLHPGILAPYEAYLRARWLEGYHNTVGLHRELIARGYTGSRMTVERFPLALRQAGSPDPQAAHAATLALTPRRVIGILLRPPVERSAEEQQAWQQVRAIHPSVLRALTLAEELLRMVRERQGDQLLAWMASASHCGFRELRTFVAKLRQDQEAVQAGLVLHWNNGGVEGQITHLKLLKRQGYGRAGLDWLRLRVLGVSANNQAQLKWA